MKYDLNKQRNLAFAVDFILCTALALTGEAISQKALDFFYSGFSFSIAALPLLILLFRWGVIAVPSLLFLGVGSSLFLQAAAYEAYVINIIGYAGFALSLIVFLKPGREAVRTGLHHAFLYIWVGFSGMVMLRSLMLTAFEGNLISSLLLITSNESLSFISCSLLFILLRKKGILIYLPAVYRDEISTSEKESFL